MSSEQEMALQQQIQTDIISIVDFILALDSNIEIILSFYDYPNFVDTINGVTGIVCNNLLTDLGKPSTALLNNTARDFESIYAQITANNPRVYHVSHFGLMQNYYGFPPGIQPGDIAFPVGDASLQSPLAAMREIFFGVYDCFHLSPSSYEVLVENLFQSYFHTRFDTLFKTGFE